MSFLTWFRGVPSWLSWASAAEASSRLHDHPHNQRLPTLAPHLPPCRLSYCQTPSCLGPLLPALLHETLRPPACNVYLVAEGVVVALNVGGGPCDVDRGGGGVGESACTLPPACCQRQEQQQPVEPQAACAHDAACVWLPPLMLPLLLLLQMHGLARHASTAVNGGRPRALALPCRPAWRCLRDALATCASNRPCRLSGGAGCCLSLFYLFVS